MFTTNRFRLSAQAEAVKAYLENNYDGIEPSWDDQAKAYDEVSIAPWYNGREKGYVLEMHKDRNQIAIAFYEHRNSDSIVVLIWLPEKFSINPRTLADAPWNVPGQKYQTEFFSYNKAYEVAQFIYDTLESWYKGEYEVPDQNHTV